MDKEYLSKIVSKEQLYRIYEAVNEEFKDYDRITRRKMLDSIKVQFQKPEVLKSFIRDHEFEILKDVYEKKSVKKTIDHRDLLDKLILLDDGEENCRINPDILDVLQPMLNGVQRNHVEKYTEYIIGLIHYFGILRKDEVHMFLQDYFKDVDYDEFYDHISNYPVINYLFLCPSEYHICKYDLFEDVVEIVQNSKEHEYMNYIPADKELLSIARYGMNMIHPKIQRFYEELLTFEYFPQVSIYDRLIHGAHLGYDFIEFSYYYMLYDEDHNMDALEEGFYELPSGSYYGLSKNQYEKFLNKKMDENVFKTCSQKNAHLSKSDLNEFVKLYMSILNYIDYKFKICKTPGAKIQPEEIYKLRSKLIEYPNIIDQFIKDPLCKLNEDEKHALLNFKDLKGGKGVLVSHEEKGSIFMLDDFFYQAIGLERNIADTIQEDLPLMCDVLLLPFKGKIVVDGMIITYPVEIGEGYRSAIKNLMKDSYIIQNLSKYN